jgi:hypothetical protein
LDRFEFPRNVIIDNAQAFKSAKIIHFFQNYNIDIGNSTSYYPQGKDLVESSNKSLIGIIKKKFSQNKKSMGFSLEI